MELCRKKPRSPPQQHPLGALGDQHDAGLHQNVDLYDRKNKIPFDRITGLFDLHLKSGRPQV
jgi:hypothetical protein